MSDVFCLSCGLECTFHVEDHGIGPCEFWGVPFTDTRHVLVSDCCEAGVDGYSYSEWSADEAANEADWRADCARDERDGL